MKAPLQGSSFQLDVSGIAGFFGGEEAFAAMSSVHLVRGRKWLGFYNSPGSYFVAKKYGVLARSRVWDGLYPGVNVDPAKMLELDGKTGSPYVALKSGTRLAAPGHLAYLLERHCGEERKREEKEKAKQIGKRGFWAACHRGQSSDIEDGTKSQAKADTKKPRIGLSIVYLNELEGTPEYLEPSQHSFTWDTAVAFIAIGYSLGACVLCAIFEDWFCFAMILLGILSNGISCFIIGLGDLRIKPTSPSKSSPPGDGVLDNNDEMVLLMGSEQSVTTVTKGKFYLFYRSETEYHDLGWCAALLTTQFLLQLFIIPQGTLFGQIMFLSSLAVSWLYNAYLASLDSESLQRGILKEIALDNTRLSRVSFQKRTAAVVFIAVYGKAVKLRRFLDDMIPNDTPAWELIKTAIASAISSNKDPKKFAEEDAILRQKIEALPDDGSGLVRDMLTQASLGLEMAQKELKKLETSEVGEVQGG